MTDPPVQGPTHARLLQLERFCKKFLVESISVSSCFHFVRTGAGNCGVYSALNSFPLYENYITVFMVSIFETYPVLHNQV